jgi:hypothetical protein
VSSGMLRRAALVRTDVSEDPSASETSALKTATRRNISEGAILPGLDWSDSGLVDLESTCEYGNELEGSIKCWENMEWLLEWCSTPQSYLLS